MATLSNDITAKAAARIIGVSHSQVIRYTAAGMLAHRWMGSQLVIKRRDAERFKRPRRGNPNYLP